MGWEDAVGNIAGALIGSDAQRDANAANRQMSWHQMEWQERMRNSAHWAEARDLESAGLNRMLTMKGSGAPMPSVPSPGEQKPIFEPHSLQRVVTTALDARRLENEVKGLNSTIGLQSAQGAASTASAMKDVATAKQTEVATKTIEAQLNAVRAESKNREGQAEWDRTFQEYDNVLKRLSNGLDAGVSAKDLASPLPSFKKNDPKPKPKMDTKAIGLP